MWEAINNLVNNAIESVFLCLDKIAIVAIPVVNFGLAIFGVHTLFEVMITLDYILYAHVSSSFMPILIASFWHQVIVIALVFVAIVMLNNLWAYLIVSV